MSKQTAVEWLFKQLEGYEYNRIKRKNSLADSIKHLEYLKEKAKAMEKEQIEDANISGMEFIPADPSMYKQDAEQYYNETYGGQNERNT